MEGIFSETSHNRDMCQKYGPYLHVTCDEIITAIRIRGNYFYTNWKVAWKLELLSP